MGVKGVNKSIIPTYDTVLEHSTATTNVYSEI